MTDHKEKTALMQAIEIVQDRCVDLSIVDNMDNPHARESIKEHEATIAMLQSLLPAEKQQMRKCYALGEGDSKFDTKTRFEKGLHFETYYNETYGE